MAEDAAPEVAIARLQIENLSHSYDGRKVVEDVSLEVRPGQVTCLLGPSGCGKSTTLRLVAGVERQQSGTILVDGRVVCDNAHSVPPEQRQIGLMFQDFALFPHLTVEQNVGFGLNADKRRSKRVAELLDRLDMTRHASSFPHELSGGEQQRVALARALAPKPKIMLMDEPFSGLDNRLRDGIRDETLEILREQGAAVLLVTHEPDEAMRMADEIALMRDGRIVQHGSPIELFNAPVDSKAAAFFSDINILKGKVDNGQVVTPFGVFDTTTLSRGTSAHIVVRPQHMRLDLDRNGTGPAPTKNEGEAVRAVVKRARLMGKESLVELNCVSDNVLIKASVPGVFLPKTGTFMWLMVPRNKCFIFPDW
ncbi:MAG: ABC transporter ATP-binding protein [Pseudomonadota bacterium]